MVSLASKMTLLKVVLGLSVISFIALTRAENLTETFGHPKRQINSIDPYYYYYGPFSAPYYNYFNTGDDYEKASLRGLLHPKTDGPQERFLKLSSLINTAVFNNRFTEATRPLSSFINRLPIFPNPEQTSPLSAFESCKGLNAEAGICAPSAFCTVFGGSPSGSCFLGNVCCINTVSRCGSTVTLNNTYWQSPFTAGVGSSCSVNIRLDQTLKEQKYPICQIRLDFLSFTISQPNSQTVCATDTFQVAGALNNVPTICGDNDDQHMYIHVPSSGSKPSDVQLMFTFGTGTSNVQRSWKIKIAMLPCGASYLAPANCVQYFDTASGSVRSFNWRDTPRAARQLANQNYNICFRTELVGSGQQRANTLCISECRTANPNIGFKISGASTNLTSQAATDACLDDFILFVGGSDPAVATANNRDRFCGGALNVTAAGNAATACTTIEPFRIFYRTNGDELADDTAGTTVVSAANMGFCLNFLQRNP